MRPFRLQPPNVESALLRRHVQKRLLQRFEQRVTTIRAGAGFGKTTSLAQAVDQNHLDPRGLDFWLTCESGDEDADHLMEGLLLTCGLSPDGALSELTSFVAGQSPASVCLILDDVHEISQGGQGAAMLGRLLDELPSNGHLVISSRTKPPIALARLDAQGQVGHITTDELALDDEEVATIATQNNADLHSLTGFGGWPALVSLAARTNAVIDFLDEEVLGWLTDDQSRSLIALVTLGGANDALLDRVTGCGAASVADLPLVHEHNGWFEAHSLWSEPIDRRIDENEARLIRTTGIEALLEAGDLHRAVDASIRAGNSELLDVAIRRIIVEPMAFDRGEVRRWWNRLPGDLLNSAAGNYLAGLVAQGEDPTNPTGRDLLSSAAEGFRSIGDSDAEVAALVQVGYWHHIQRDAGGLFTVGLRLGELAQEGVRLAEPYVAIGEAFIGLAQGDAEKALAAVRKVEASEITPGFQAITAWAHAQGLEMAGHPSIEQADAAAVVGLPIPGVSIIAFSARWRNGMIEDLLADRSWWNEPDNSRDYFLRHVWLAVVAGATGDIATAQRHMTKAESAAGAGAEQIDIALGLLRAAIADVEGDRDAVKSGLAELLGSCPLAESNRFTYGGGTSLILRHFTEHDDYFLRPDLGPLRRRDIELGLVLRELDGGSLAAVAGIHWPERHGELLPAVYCRGACEIIAAAWAVGRVEAEPAATWMANVIGEPARSVFRDLTQHPLSAVAEAAEQIVALIPVAPDGELRVQVLGPAELSRDGARISDANWRRERVRSLLGYLISHPSTTREAVMAALWPDADEVAGRRNLRSTLNLLNQVIEPGRSGGDAPFFIRSEGPTLRLHPGEKMHVDVWAFELLVDSAERLEADGVPELALEPLASAVEMYQGDFLADAAYDDWSAAERDRLRARFVRAAVRLAELLVAFNRIDEALVVAGKAIGVEPWSEPAHRVVVASYLELGDRSAARRALDRCTTELADFGGPTEELTLMLARRLAG